MSIRQTVFGCVTALGVTTLGGVLSTVDPVGWNLVLVGAGLGALTLASALLQIRPQWAPAPAHAVHPSHPEQAG